MKRPRVLINGLKLGEGRPIRLTGNFYHVFYLAEALSRRPDLEITVLTDDITHDAFATVIPAAMLCHSGRGSMNVLQADWTVRAHVKQLKPDVYHRPTGQLPLFPLGCKAVASIADLNFSVLPTPAVKYIYKEISYRLTVRNADWITCVSEYTRGEVLRRYKYSSAKVSVVPHGTNSLPQPNYDMADELKDRFWLSFGHEAHKNVEVVMRALSEKYGHDYCRDLLAVVGVRPELEASVRALALDLGIGHRVRFLGHVSQAQLAGLYSRAIGLVFMSRYEGFGMPILEAMRLGCPVIASNVCSLPEVVGDAGIIVGVNDAAELARVMNNVSADPQQHAAMSIAGRVRAAKFSWDAAADKYADIYHQLSRT